MVRWSGLAVACAMGFPALAAADPVPQHDGLNALVWMQTSAEYKATTIGAFAAARLALDAALADPDWTACPEQTGPVRGLPPAVILDIDDTILDTTPYQAWLLLHNEPYSAESFADWVEERGAEPVPGAAEYLAYLRAKGIVPVFVSNRAARLEEATRDVLAAIGVTFPQDFDTVMLKRERKEWTMLKGSRRAEAAKRYRILQVVGDNLGDFIDDFGVTISQRAQSVRLDTRAWGTKWVMLPNPTYGNWENAAVSYDVKLDDNGRRAEKLRALSPWK